MTRATGRSETTAARAWDLRHSPPQSPRGSSEAGPAPVAVSDAVPLTVHDHAEDVGLSEDGLGERLTFHEVRLLEVRHVRRHELRAQAHDLRERRQDLDDLRLAQPQGAIGPEESQGGFHGLPAGGLISP